MEIEGRRRRDIHFVEQIEVHKLIERKELRSAITLALARRQFPPLRWKPLPVLIFGIKQVAFVEADAEAPFARMVAAVRAAKAIMNMVVNDAIVNHSGFPVKQQPAFVARAV